MIKDSNERNRLALKYHELIHKIAHQLENQSNEPYDDLVGYANTGFTEAMNDYEEDKSDQTFAQYAAYRIRFAILNGINENSRTIRVSAYNQKKIAKGEAEDIQTTSLDTTFDGDDMYTDHVAAIGVDDYDPYTEVTTMRKLYKAIEKAFPKRDCEILYSRFGLNGRPQIECKEIGEKYGISGPRISAILKKMYEYIKAKKELADELRDLLNNL